MLIGPEINFSTSECARPQKEQLLIVFIVSPPPLPVNGAGVVIKPRHPLARPNED